MMKSNKAIYFVSSEKAEIKHGVHKKIIGQAKSFRSYGYSPYYAYIYGNEVCCLDLTNNITHTLGYVKGIIGRFFGFYNIIYQELSKYCPGVVYIRASFHYPAYIKFLKRIKNKGITIIQEIPTFPYDAEYLKGSIIKQGALHVDKYYRNKLKDHVSLIVSYTKHSSIFNIPVAKIENGIEIERIVPRNISRNKKSLVLFAAANLSFWHGYDRLIKGLYEYYQKYNEPIVEFWMAGDGKELSNLITLRNKLGLTDVVKFIGRLAASELLPLYNQVDIGVDVLGMHRRGFNQTSSLKAREYCAVGLPFITSLDDEFDENFRFQLKLPANETPIDIQKVINFSVIIDKENTIEEMTDYARNNLLWTNKMKPIVDFLENQFD